MSNKTDPAKPNLSGPPIWKVCAGSFFLCFGLSVIFSVIFKWISGFWIPQITQFGLISIWTGILFLQTGKTYFSVISSFILLLSLVGFADNLIYDVHQPTNSDPKYVVHGLFCFAWMIAFAVQADLVRRGRLRLHKKIGIAGFLAAVGFIISTIYLFYAIWVPWEDMMDRVKINRILLPSFAVLILLSWICRDRPEYHKRMILMGTLYLLQPIISRAVSGFLPVQTILWNGLFASLFVYDWCVSKKIHPVTYLGTAWFYFAWGIVKLT